MAGDPDVAGILSILRMQRHESSIGNGFFSAKGGEAFLDTVLHKCISMVCFLDSQKDDVLYLVGSNGGCFHCSSKIIIRIL